MATDSLFTFFVDGLHSYLVHVKPEATEVINALGRDVIHFRRVVGEDKASFVTGVPAVAKYLRAEQGNLAETIREDLRQYQVLRCPKCDFQTDGNSTRDQKTLADHIAAEHDDTPKSNVKTGKITAGQ